MARTKNPSYVPTPDPVDEDDSSRDNSAEDASDETETNDGDLPESEDEAEVMPPLGLHFNYSDYTKPFKLSGKCYIAKAVKLLEGHLKEDELQWFLNHPQFMHFFHMPKDPNHKLMGMWMLLLRTAKLEKKNECWFIVNGVPIRYSLRDMAMISGLNCKNYPRNWERLGGLTFVGKHFAVGSTIKYEDIKAKLLSLKKPSPDRLKMAVLFFLSSIIIGQRKGGKKATSVFPFFLRAVEDLELCKVFPWGRLAFDENMKDIFHMVRHFDGELGAQWVFPSFITPLEVLAFEAIPVLKNMFREDVKNQHAHRKCPRMCKMKFKQSKKKGFSLKEIYDQLGTTQEIHSIITPSSREVRLLETIMDQDGGWNDVDDPVADGWSKRLIEQGKSICFEEHYNQDVAARVFDANPSIENVDDVVQDDVCADDDVDEDVDVNQEKEDPIDLSQLGASLLQLEARVNKGFEEINEKFDVMDERIKTVELYVKWVRSGDEGSPTDNYGGSSGGELEKAEMERAEKERAEEEKAEKEKAEKEKAEKEKAEKEKAEKERAEKEKAEKEKAQKEKAQKERAEKEKAEKEKAAEEKAEKERAEEEKAEKERAEKEKAEKEKAKKEKAEKERAEKDKAEKEKAEKEKAEKERAEKEKAEKEKAEGEKERAEKEKAEMEKVEKEQAEKGGEEGLVYKRKKRSREGEAEVESHVGQKVKIISKKGTGPLVVVRSPYLTRQSKN